MGVNKLKNFFVLTTLLATTSFYLFKYSCDEFAALVSVMFLVLMTSALFGKLVRVKLDFALNKRIKRKFFKMNKLKD